MCLSNSTKLHKESRDAIWCPEFSLPLEDTFLADWHFPNGTDEGGEWGSDWINDPAQISDTSCQSLCPWSWCQSWLYPSDPCHRTLTSKYQPTQMNVAYHNLKRQCKGSICMAVFGLACYHTTHSSMQFFFFYSFIYYSYTVFTHIHYRSKVEGHMFGFLKEVS